MFPRPTKSVAIWLAVALSSLGLGAPLSCTPIRGWILKWINPNRFVHCGSAFIAGFAIVVIGMFWLIYKVWPAAADWLTNGDQPMIWLEGISLWPTIFLRAIAFLLCVLLLLHGLLALSINMDKIAIYFDLNECVHLKKEPKSSARPDSLLTKRSKWFFILAGQWCRVLADVRLSGLYALSRLPVARRSSIDVSVLVGRKQYIRTFASSRTRHQELLFLRCIKHIACVFDRFSLFLWRILRYCACGLFGAFV
jgi:hypothetical protein